ncbi:type III-D CRISPR-associated RAMP protein Csx10 [Lyngbya confervoides]|uniref:CRISPR-associated RAMP protein Csx10 n=1 Tax=Lyngbya confervoides BDU141951 TaxID=1574623 RepID=A0ABD4T5R1_9CYAN|nr:CRISPR-associated RAMP protein Csx10 [Lyngbya confervoides]MCM1983758.1 CRISPR-associated RAMP protein Csx10 [Lyngbya confervoides BDU141951]
MTCIQLVLNAQAPLAIGRSKPGGSISQSETYIPGSVIRGAIASELIRLSESENHDFSTGEDDFNALFLGENAAIFQNAYPVEYSKIQNPALTRVIPSTAATAKSNPGFIGKGAGVFDTLIDRYCARLHGQIYDPVFPDEAGGRVEPLSGFYQEIAAGQYVTPSVSTRLLTRVGINRRRATAQEKILYSIEVINETESGKNHPACFMSYLHLPDQSLCDPLVKFLDGRIIRVGGSASRGLGKVKLEAKRLKKKLNFRKRYDTFNQCVGKQWRQWNQLFAMNATINAETFKQLRFFSINLESDAILQEDWQRTMVLSPQLLQEFANIPNDSLQLEGSSCSYDYVSGWNSAWGLMKDTDLITQKGACFLYSIHSEHECDWLRALEHLENMGVGDRRTEGFGQIYVCNPFHLNTRETII